MMTIEQQLSSLKKSKHLHVCLFAGGGGGREGCGGGGTKQKSVPMSCVPV